jgi:Family of unknown function (DUF6115)
VLASVPLICLAALVTACAPIWLFLRLRGALRRLAGSITAQEQLFTEAKALNARLAAIETRLNAIDQSRDAHSEWLSQAEGLNLNRRGQVLRLHRRGDSTSDIAAALRMGKGEVQLMIKVYELGRNGLSAERL